MTATALLEVMIEMTVPENLSAEKNLSKDAALTTLVKNQSRLTAIASQIYERAQPGDRRVVISPADLNSDPRRLLEPHFTNFDAETARLRTKRVAAAERLARDALLISR